jgi:hypothetical protein
VIPTHDDEHVVVAALGMGQAQALNNDSAGKLEGELYST